MRKLTPCQSVVHDLVMAHHPRSSAQRIAREVKDVANDKASGITVVPYQQDQLMHLKGTFHGPEGT
jgi:ubiquitin-protein ligase